jgi:hypothetical protein
VGSDVIMPQFDPGIPRLTGNADLIENRSRLDGAGVERVGEVGHELSLDWDNGVSEMMVARRDAKPTLR